MKYYIEIFGNNQSNMPVGKKGTPEKSLRFEITEDLDPINLLEYLKSSVKEGVIGFLSDAENKLVIVPSTSISCVEVKFSKETSKILLRADTSSKDKD